MPSRYARDLQPGDRLANGRDVQYVAPIVPGHRNITTWDAGSGASTAQVRDDDVVVLAD